MRSGVSRIMTDLTAPVKPLPAVDLSIHIAPPRFNAGCLGNSPNVNNSKKKSRDQSRSSKMLISKCVHSPPT